MNSITGNNFTDLQLQMIKMKQDGFSSRYIAEKLLGSKSKKSTVNDLYTRYLAQQGVTSSTPLKTPVGLPKKPYYTIETVKQVGNNVTHLMIPDTQCKPDIDMSYLDWLGQYIVDKKPEVIVHIGDHADMESLSSYDKGQRSAEGKRVHKDIDSAK